MFRQPVPLFLVTALLLCGGGVPRVLAQNEGLQDLDQATDAKWSAQSLSDLTEVIDKAQAAMNKGLDETNTVFARELLAETLMERVTVLSGVLFENQVPGDGRTNIQLWNVAVSDLRRVVKLRPEQGEAHFLLGRLYVYADSRAEARTALDACLAAKDVTPDLKAKALTLRAGLQETEAQRRADYDQACVLAPENADICRTRGLYLLSKGDIDAALVDLDRSITLDPKNAPTYQARGMALFAKQQYDAALESFARALQLNPDLAAAHWYRSRVFRQKKDHQAAIAELDKVLDRNPQDLTSLAQRAEIHLETRDFADALADVDEILRLRKGNVAAMMLRAEVLASSERMDEAIASLTNLARQMPDRIELQLQLARYYLIDHRPKHAIETLDHVLSGDHTNWLALRIRGDALLASGDQTRAIVDFQAALEQRPDDSSTLNNLAWVLATSPDDQLRNPARAVELATKACEITEYKQAHVLSTLAAAYADEGKFDIAIEWSEKAVAIGKQEVGYLKKVNELRAERDLDPLRGEEEELGNLILDPQYIQAWQTLRQERQEKEAQEQGVMEGDEGAPGGEEEPGGMTGDDWGSLMGEAAGGDDEDIEEGGAAPEMGEEAWEGMMNEASAKKSLTKAVVRQTDHPDTVTYEIDLEE